MSWSNRSVDTPIKAKQREKGFTFWSRLILNYSLECDGPDRIDIALSAARARRSLRLLFRISLKGGNTGGGTIAVASAFGGGSWPVVTVIGASSAPRTSCMPLNHNNYFSRSALPSTQPLHWRCRLLT
jgi:hypothetical protein